MKVFRFLYKVQEFGGDLKLDRWDKHERNGRNGSNERNGCNERNGRNEREKRGDTLFIIRVAVIAIASSSKWRVGSQSIHLPASTDWMSEKLNSSTSVNLTLSVPVFWYQGWSSK